MVRKSATKKQVGHTPGKWSVAADSITVMSQSKVFGPHRLVAQALSLDGMKQRLADARLIASAPVLLEAINQIIEINACDYDEAMGSASEQFANKALAIHRIAQAAIAKATGATT